MCIQLMLSLCVACVLSLCRDSNDIPSVGKFDSKFARFYALSASHCKPVLVAETGSLWSPDFGGPSELSVKSAWWDQVYDAAHVTEYPLLVGAVWFELVKQEHTVGQNGNDESTVDWRVLLTNSSEVVAAFKNKLHTFPIDAWSTHKAVETPLHTPMPNAATHTQPMAWVTVGWMISGIMLKDIVTGTRAMTQP